MNQYLKMLYVLERYYNDDLVSLVIHSDGSGSIESRDGEELWGFSNLQELQWKMLEVNGSLCLL